MKVQIIAPEKDALKLVQLLDKGIATQVIKPEELVTAIQSRDEKIIAVRPNYIDWNLSNEILEKAENLKAICTRSAWAEYLDLEYCRENNIRVTNTPQANSQAVAEYAIWMMFSLARKFPLQLSDKFKNINDDKHLNSEVKGKVAGIVGYGNIGSRIADMCFGLGMEVVYWNRSDKDSSYPKVEIEKLLSSSDFIFNCLETSSGTVDFFSKERIDMMKASSSYISVIGGFGWGNADDDYLISKLSSGEIAGIAVENAHKLGYKLPEVERGTNLFIPATYAWYTKEAQDSMDKMWAEGVNGIVFGTYKYLV